MAYRKSNGKLSRRKIEPAVQTLYFNTGQTPGNSSAAYYIDLSQVASLVNRRFYRQGINWMVGSIKIFTGAAGGVTIQKLPTTWVMKNSWTKGFATWQDMNKKAVENQESIKPRFLDFKIYADKDHHLAGSGANLLPRTFEINAAAPGGLDILEAAPGEWEYSKYSVPRTDGTDTALSREIVATGANYPGVGASGFQAVSLIEGYAASRALPVATEDPNTPTDTLDVSGSTPQNWMNAITNEGIRQDEIVVEDMTTENNLAPYPFEGDNIHTDTMYPGGANQLRGLQIHDTAVISNTTIGSTTHMKGGEFYCGLMKIVHQVDGETSANLGIQIDLIPGPHRGYMCESMGA